MKIKRLDVYDEGIPVKAEVEVIVMVNVADSVYGGGRGRIDLNLFFEQQNEKWKLTDYNYGLMDM